VYNREVAPIHAEILAAAQRLSADAQGGPFRIADLLRALPHLNAGTVRTHVASRCCVNAPAHHQSRHPYFRALGRGVYRLEPRYRRQRPAPQSAGTTDWQSRLIAAMPSGIDDTLIRASLALSPTDRIETMRRAALSLEAMRRR
jgi:hypothetical protein